MKYYLLRIKFFVYSERYGNDGSYWVDETRLVRAETYDKAVDKLKNSIMSPHSETDRFGDQIRIFHDTTSVENFTIE